MAERYISQVNGWNSRLDELQAAILRVKLRHLPESNQRRRALAQLYNEHLSALPVITPLRQAHNEHVYHQYVIRHPRRNDMQSFLATRNIATLVHYPVPIHLQPAYRGKLGDSGSFPVSEECAREILSLPLYPQLTEGDVQTVVQAIADFCEYAAR